MSSVLRIPGIEQAWCAWPHFIMWCHNLIPEGKACGHRPLPAQPYHTAVCCANTLGPQVAVVTIITTSYPPTEYWNSPHECASSRNNKHEKGGQIWKVEGGIQWLLLVCEDFIEIAWCFHHCHGNGISQRWESTRPFPHPLLWNDILCVSRAVSCREECLWGQVRHTCTLWMYVQELFIPFPVPTPLQTG